MKVLVRNISVFEDEEVFQTFYQKMPEERQRKIDCCARWKDKRLSLAAGVLLQEMLQEYGVDDANLRIGYGENQKPYLLDYPDIHYNLSHSGEMAMCIAADTEVGCDIEEINPHMNLGIAKRFFTTNEYEAIMREETEDKKKDMFFRLWTLKESFLKVTGLGMKLPLNSFEMILGDSIQVKYEGNLAAYEFREYCYEHYKAAVCRLCSEDTAT